MTLQRRRPAAGRTSSARSGPKHGIDTGTTAPAQHSTRSESGGSQVPDSQTGRDHQRGKVQRHGAPEDHARGAPEIQPHHRGHEHRRYLSCRCQPTTRRSMPGRPAERAGHRCRRDRQRGLIFQPRHYTGALVGLEGDKAGALPCIRAAEVSTFLRVGALEWGAAATYALVFRAEPAGETHCLAPFSRTFAGQGLAACRPFPCRACLAGLLQSCRETSSSVGCGIGWAIYRVSRGPASQKEPPRLYCPAFAERPEFFCRLQGKTGAVDCAQVPDFFSSCV